MAERYEIVFTGRLRPGADLDQVMDAFARRFDLGPDTVRAMLAQEAETVLKSDVPLLEANRLKEVLEGIGMSVSLRPLSDSFDNPPDLELVPKAEGETVNPSGPAVMTAEHLQRTGVVCPKCGTQQPHANMCVKCGLVFSKYFHRVAQDKESEAAIERSTDRRPSVDARSGGVGFGLGTVVAAVLVVGVAGLLVYWLFY